jgi:hypothetical protein
MVFLYFINILWVAQTSSELISNNGSTEMGPELPQGLGNHAIISINETSSLLIGGTDLNDVMDSTYFFSHETEKWTEGPKLIQGRQGHAGGLITDKITKETLTIVVGGQNHVTTDVLDTTEILIEGV